MHAWFLSSLILMTKKIAPLVALILTAGAPLSAYAQLTVPQLIANIKTQILIPVISLLFILATVIFIWGVITYFIKGGADTGAQTKARQLALYGIIGMSLMLGAWGLVQIICNFFGNACNPRIPFQ